jgi:ubiquinone/menaquinone biosynthesis C-methylase UbiE
MDFEKLKLTGPYAVTRDSYDTCARAYDAWCRGYAPYLESWDVFIDLLPETPRVVDLGCGSGAFVERLLAKRPRAEVEGFDFSTELLSLAKAAVPSAKWNLADIRSVVLPGNSFDAVVLSGSLTHLRISECTKLLIESILTLRRGGMLYASFTEAETVRVEQGSFETAVFGGELPFYCNRNAVQDVAAAFKGAGLELLSLERIGACGVEALAWHAPEAVVYGRRK